MHARVSATANINLKTCGGNSKAGLPSLVGLSPLADRAITGRSYPTPGSKFYISYANVLSGGVGRERAGLMFKGVADGVNKNYILNEKKHCKYNQARYVL